MTKRPTLEVARGLALQKVGRNVVNFQKMEAILKYISVFARLHGPISEVAKSVAKKTGEIAKRPMGQLVTEAACNLHRDRRLTQQAPTEVAEAWLSYSVTIGEKGNDARKWRKAMNAVVTERNALIHQMLATFNPDSVESCESLCRKLDEQRSRILAAYEHLQSIVLAIRESHRDLATNVDDIVAQGLAQGSSEDT